MQRQLTARGQQRRDEIVAFATVRFAENGFHPTSVAEIVSGLGVGKGVFYWYFESKDELLGEILRTALRSLRTAQAEAVTGEDDPVRRIELAIRAALRWSEQNRHLVTLIQFASTDDRFAPLVSLGEAVAVRDATGQVTDAVAVGRLRNADPEFVAHAVLGVTTHMAREFIHKRGRPADEVADATMAFVLEGLLAGAISPVG